MLARGESAFVKEVSRDRRDRVLDSLYWEEEASRDVVKTVLEYALFGASVIVVTGCAGLLKKDIAYGYHCVWTDLVFTGVFIATFVAGTHSVRSVLTPEPESLRRVFIPRLGLHANAIAMILITIALVAPIVNVTGHRALDIIHVVGSSILLFTSLLHILYFRCFYGLFAPVWPSKQAPTVIPLFTVNLLAAVFYLTAAGLAFQPSSLMLLRYMNWFRFLGWVCWLLSAYGQVLVSYVMLHHQIPGFEAVHLNVGSSSTASRSDDVI